jgi:dTDP-4-dehydrorhamnose reductase
MGFNTALSRSLVIGASGQIGENLYDYLIQNGNTVVGTYYKTQREWLKFLNIHNMQEVMELFANFIPDTVFFPASLTNVDYCETHPIESFVTNVQGVKNVVLAANQVGAKIIYFSSDYIFDGESGPYRENDLPNPICVYGLHKVFAEHFVGLHANNYLIIRTTVVYGWERQGKNFIVRLLRALQHGKTVNVPVDQIGNPTYAPDLTQSVVELVGKSSREVYNIAGRSRTSRFEFAIAAANIFGLNPKLIKPTETQMLKQVALDL